MEEVWKDIIGYEGLYQISNLGNVKSLIGKEKILKGGIDKDGYRRIVLCKNHKYKTFGVHRIVAQMFIPNPNKLPQVNHKDENKLNNIVNNLEWCDCLYNNNYGSRSTMYNNNKKEINQYTKDGIYIKTWNGASDIEKELNYFATRITSCCKNRGQTAYGYVWKYNNKNNCNINIKLNRWGNLKKKINQYDLNNEFIKTWNSCVEIEKELGIKVSNIISCCKGKQKTSHNFIWKYYND